MKYIPWQIMWSGLFKQRNNLMRWFTKLPVYVEGLRSFPWNIIDRLCSPTTQFYLLFVLFTISNRLFVVFIVYVFYYQEIKWEIVLVR